MNLSLILLGSGGLYLLFDLYRTQKQQLERKKKLPQERLFTLFDVALEDEDSLNKPLGIAPYKTTLKAGNYFPSLYTNMLRFMPVAVAASFGIMTADYLADKLRRRAAKKRLEQLNNEFDQLMDTTIELVKAKQEAKMASVIGGMLGTAANTVLSIPISLVAPGLSHSDIVNAYTMTIVPYAFWSSYEAAKEASPSSETKRAITQYALQSRAFSIPAAASISALQKAIQQKYAIQRAKQNIASRQSQIDYSQYFKSKAPTDESMTEHKNRLTVEEIYNLAKEQQQGAAQPSQNQQNQQSQNQQQA